MKILFMGTPDFAKESLEAIYEAGHEILGVVTNPDKPKGRGMKLVASPVKEYALSKELEIYQPEKVKNNVKFIEKMKHMSFDGAQELIDQYLASIEEYHHLQNRIMVKYALYDGASMPKLVKSFEDYEETQNSRR